MVRKLCQYGSFFFVLILLLSIGVPLTAEKILVVDLADFFTAADETRLTQDAQALGLQYGMDIVIVTTKDTMGKSSRVFADDYYDNNGYGVGANKDGILFLLDYANRQAYISTSGSGIRYLTDARIESILDAVMSGGLKAGNNLGATQAFLKSTAGFLAAGIPAGQRNVAESINNLSFLDLIIGLIAAGSSSLGFFAITRGVYKGTPKPNIFEYRSNSIVSMGISADNLVNTFVTSRIIPPPSSSSGSRSGTSSTHTSSGGSTHGGGGRGF